MSSNHYLRYIVDEIHSTVVATVDDKGLPVTCAIDIMDSDEKGLYFLTAKGKGFYDRLKKSGYATLTGIKGKDTLSCVAISIRGKVRELGTELLPHLFEKNPYMKEIYPTERASFTIGNEQKKIQGYEITHKCIGCKSCQPVCPQNCIDFTIIPAVIKQENCLHCGNCLRICPQKAVVRRG